MKGVYILLGLLILAGGYYFINNSSTPAETEPNLAPASAESPSVVTTESEPEPAATVESTGSVSLEPSGSDAGMEYPIADDESLLETKVFNLEAFSFGFDTKEIRVKKGDRVTINLSVVDGFHDWVVNEFSAATEQVRAGGLTSVTFVADKVGTFEYYCSVGNHRALGMVGKLIVE